MTPFLTAKLAGKYVAVDAAGLLVSTLQVSFPSQMLSLFLLCCDASLSLLTPFSHQKMNCFSILSQQVVLFPVLGGALMNQYFQPLVKLVSPLMPPLAVATVAILCGNAIAQSSSAILMSGGQVILAVCLLHASGFFFGYVLARCLGLDVSSSRTISIEVGMQVKIVFCNCNFITIASFLQLFGYYRFNYTSIYPFFHSIL